MYADGEPLPVRLQPELLDDVDSIFISYEAQTEGIGHSFTQAFYAAVARAARQPTAGLYSSDHGGAYPADLDQLSPNYIHDVHWLLKTGGDVHYVYVPGRTEESNTTAIILYSDCPVRAGRYFVIAVDCAAKFATKQELEANLRDFPPASPPGASLLSH